MKYQISDAKNPKKLIDGKETLVESDRIVPIQPIYLANLRDHVHHNLRDAILAGRFRSGERLNERDLARELGVSTTPLKEALRQLEAEGLIRTESRRGVYVTFGAQQAEEMTLARLIHSDPSEIGCAILAGGFDRISGMPSPPPGVLLGG